MPSPEQNRAAHTNLDWSTQGDRWSTPWGGSDFLWWGTIFPRLHRFLPTESILEIAPGYGRCTQFLANLGRRLTIVDVTEGCIDACKQRFGGLDHLHYIVNDGKSLDGIPDESIDFIFSWDSLVHAESDVMRSYITEFARVMKPDAAGFIHHSNLGRYSKEEREGRKLHWRGTTMRADLFQSYCRDAGLHCSAQELIRWGCDLYNDCFSLFVKGAPTAKTLRVENPDFKPEIDRIRVISQLYAGS